MSRFVLLMPERAHRNPISSVNVKLPQTYKKVEHMFLVKRVGWIIV